MPSANKSRPDLGKGQRAAQKTDGASGAPRSQYTKSIADPVLCQRITDALMASGGKRHGAEVRFRCPHPAHTDGNASCDWNASKGTYVCRSCSARGGAVHLARLLGVDLPTRRTTTTPKAARPTPTPTPKSTTTPKFTGPKRAMSVFGMPCKNTDAEHHKTCKGMVTFTHWRQDTTDGKLMWWDPKPSDHNLTPADFPLYGAKDLPADLTGVTVAMTEGQKAAKALIDHGILAVGTQTGASGTPGPEAMRALARARVVLFPDADPAGDAHMQSNGAALVGVAGGLAWLAWPDAPQKGDAADWFDLGHTADELRELLATAPTWTPTTPLEGEVIPPGAGRDGDDGDDAPGGKRSQASVLVDLAGIAELFHTAQGAGYATIPVGMHTETHALTASGFRGWLRRQYYTATGKAPSAQGLQDALGVLEARALFDGPEMTCSVRLAEHDGGIYLDLADTEWRQVVVTPAGWRIVTAAESPVKFRRPKGLLPLPLPESGGSLADLRLFVNVATDDDFRLLVAWLVAAARPRGPYPVLLLSGEQGSAKTTTGRALRGLVDPQIAELRSAPATDRDLVIAAAGCAVLAFDNLSGIPPWLSDALCRLATGGGLGVRKLYADDEEMLFDACRPVMLTGIEDLAARPDLLDRAVQVQCPPMLDTARMTETAFWDAYAAARPALLGALCDALAGALAALPDTHLDHLPRMADFALWVTAAEAALGWAAGDFLAAYARNRETATSMALEGSVLAGPLLHYLGKRPEGWSGTATALLAALNKQRGADKEPPKGWPTRPHVLSGMLRRIAPSLRAVGWDVQHHVSGDERRIIIKQVEREVEDKAKTASRASSASPQAQNTMTLSATDDAERHGERHPASPDSRHENGTHDADDADDALFAPRSDADDKREGCDDVLQHLSGRRTTRSLEV